MGKAVNLTTDDLEVEVFERVTCTGLFLVRLGRTCVLTSCCTEADFRDKWGSPRAFFFGKTDL